MAVIDSTADHDSRPIWNLLHPPPDQTKQPFAPKYRQTTPQAKFHISGIDFHSTIAGKDILSIQADRFTIKKKKLGLFRFGLMNEGLFENTHVRIYGQWQSGKVPSEQADGGGPIRPIAVNDNPGSLSEAASFMPDRQSDQLTFNNIFSTAAFPNLPVKKVASIVMKPVQVDLYNGQTHLTRISASRAFLRFKQRDIQFKGNVTVVTGNRTLTADELIFVPEKAAMKTMGAYTLKTPEGQWSGKRMVMDIFLADNRLVRSGTDNNH